MINAQQMYVPVCFMVNLPEYDFYDKRTSVCIYDKCTSVRIYDKRTLVCIYDKRTGLYF